MNAEYGKKMEAAVAATCRDALTDPVDKLFLMGNPATNNCRLSSVLEFAAKSPTPGRWYRKALGTIPLQLWYVTLEGSMTDQTFKYLDPEEEFSEKADSSDSWSAGLTVSRFNRGRMLSLGVSRQTRYKASSSTELCLPLGESAAFNCRTTALAGPDRKDADLLRGEVRQLLGRHVGASLRAIYDLDDSEWELHGIFHFLRDPEKGLNGGIDLQYNTLPLNADASGQGGDHFTARLFVGTKFELPFLPGASS